MTYLQARPYTPLFRTIASGFHQGVLFSQLFVPPTHLRPQQLVADEMTAVRNKHHSLSTSSVEAGSCLNLDALLSANAIRTSLSANDSHWIRQVFRDRKVFRF